jgi:hypothetical protein
MAKSYGAAANDVVSAKSYGLGGDAIQVCCVVCLFVCLTMTTML